MGEGEPASPEVVVPPLLRIRDLGVAYEGGLTALRHVSMDVPAGSVVAVVGPSGAGKTTMLRAVSGLLGCHGGRVTAGTVEFAGERIESCDPAVIVRRGVSQVMQGRRIFSELTVDDNLRAGALSRPRREVAASLARVRDLFPVLAERAGSTAGYLSGGQQQMLSLGRALMASPRLLLLDEPWMGLAPGLVEQLRAAVAQIAADGVAVVLVDTQPARAEADAERCYVFGNGTVVRGGPAREAREAPAAAGRNRPDADAAQAPVLELDGVTLAFGPVLALDGVALRVGPAEVVAVIGPNGAGKTSILNCVNQVHRPDRGSVRLSGTELVGLRPERVAALGVARTFQTPAAFAHLDVLDNLLLGRHCRMRGGLVAAALALSRARTQERVERARCRELAERLGLGPSLGRPVGTLPFGLQKRVELGRAMAMDPAILLLDEPSAGMTGIEIDDMAAAIAECRSDAGPAIMIVEHDLRLVSALADRVVVMDSGRVVATGAPAEMARDPALVGAHLGAPPSALAGSG